MPTFPDLKYGLSNRELPQLSICQAVIERSGFLLPVKWTELRLGRDALSAMQIEGRECVFSCHRMSVTRVISERHLAERERWNVAYIFGGQGNLLSSVAATIAAVTYVTATQGLLYDPDAGPLHDLGLVQQSLDQVVAICCDRLDLYRVRYPFDVNETADAIHTSSRLAD